jgi:hypothetical protein
MDAKLDKLTAIIEQQQTRASGAVPLPGQSPLIQCLPLKDMQDLQDWAQRVTQDREAMGVVVRSHLN